MVSGNLPLPLSHISKRKYGKKMKDNYNLKQIEHMLLTVIELLKHLNNKKSNSGIYTQKELLQLLDISPNTLKSWENKGLKRLEPPIEGTRTVYYHIDTVLEFLNCN